MFLLIAWRFLIEYLLPARADPNMLQPRSSTSCVVLSFIDRAADFSPPPFASTIRHHFDGALGFIALTASPSPPS